MTRIWLLAFAAAVPLWAAQAQIGGASGGTATGTSSSSGANAGHSTTASTTSSNSAKDDAAKKKGANQGTAGASGLGWSVSSSPSGSTAKGAVSSSRSSLPVTTNGF
jgi:hypothetical protein